MVLRALGLLLAVVSTAQAAEEPAIPSRQELRTTFVTFTYDEGRLSEVVELAHYLEAELKPVLASSDKHFALVSAVEAQAGAVAHLIAYLLGAAEGRSTDNLSAEGRAVVATIAADLQEAIQTLAQRQGPAPIVIDLRSLAWFADAKERLRAGETIPGLVWNEQTQEPAIQIEGGWDKSGSFVGPHHEGAPRREADVSREPVHMPFLYPHDAPTPEERLRQQEMLKRALLAFRALDTPQFVALRLLYALWDASSRATARHVVTAEECPWLHVGVSWLAAISALGRVTGDTPAALQVYEMQFPPQVLAPLAPQVYLLSWPNLPSEDETLRKAHAYFATRFLIAIASDDLKLRAWLQRIHGLPPAERDGPAIARTFQEYYDEPLAAAISRVVKAP